MKKFRAPLIVFAVLILLGSMYYFTPRTFGKNVNLSDVDHINVFDGTNGVGFTVTDPGDIKRIVENIRGISLRRGKISLGYKGYCFKISYIDGNDKDVIPLFILNSDNTIRKDPFFYTCNGGLCFDYLKEIEAKYTGP